jgi:hypothetical protein
MIDPVRHSVRMQQMDPMLAPHEQWMEEPDGSLLREVPAEADHEERGAGNAQERSAGIEG